MSDMAIPVRNISPRLEHGVHSSEFSETPAKLTAIRTAIQEEYIKRHKQPWIVAYSGGKDSTLLLQLVFEVMLALPPEKRHRQIHIIANDTLVESPLVINHLKASLETVRKFVKKHDLPVSIRITAPAVDQTFWVNVIGRGYIPPTRNFRWCTDRLKIMPTSERIESLTYSHKGSVLLIGTRKAESSSRRRRMEKHSNGRRMNPHTQIKKCRVFSPIADLSDNEVWAVLLQSRPPWGGTHRTLITLYRNAGGGECPLVLSKEDAPSCGTTSPRFGCWTCTVIAKDRSLRGLISTGNDELEPLYDFREWLVKLRENKRNRMPVRRDGSTKYRADGSLVHGPFTMRVRRKILKHLRKLEREMNQTLLTAMEQRAIDEIWRIDEVRYEARKALLYSVREPVTA